MSRGVNLVILIGHLGKDPEMRSMPSGGAVANVTLATSENWKDKQTGEAKEQTEWHRVIFFNKLAEIVGQYLKKGAQVYVEGALRTRKWDDKDGVTRYSTEIVAREMRMLGSKPQSIGQTSADDYANRRTRAATETRPADQIDDEIPF